MSQYLSFLGVTMMALVVPGPDTLVVLRTSLSGGRAAGTWAAAGSSAGLLVWGAASVAGATTLLTLSPVGFAAVKLAGAAYLGVLGVQAVTAAWRGQPLASPPGDANGAPGAAFRVGFLSDLSNVKVGLFWTALVPQFLHGSNPAALGAVMTVSMSALGFAWLAGYAVLAARMRAALGGPRLGRAVNAVTGATMVALAALLLATGV